MNQSFSATVAQSTPTGNALARAVADGYALGEIEECVLLRRGFNHVFGLRFVDGRRAVARLSAVRPRGEPNTAYEAAVLAHLKLAGAAVAASFPARDQSPAITMNLPEGVRTLMVFEHLAGDSPGDALADIEATGRGLALLHEAGQSYKGPASRYVLELPMLLDDSVQRLCAAPTMTDALRADFTDLSQRLNARIAALPALTRVACHGDCHGGNNFVTDGPGGTRVASFFDFDDAGPGWLAYELCVYLWSALPQTAGDELGAAALERWRRYLAGYRSVRPIDNHDFDAITAFLPVRQIWLMGEYAARSSEWGTHVMPTYWLHKQFDRLVFWESLKTPA